MDDGALSVSRYRIYFHGRASHAGLAPEKGINALTSLVELFHNLEKWRQQLPESARVHGIITHGGDAANIVPAETSAYLYLRAPELSMTYEMFERLKLLTRSAAELTGCTYDIEQEGNATAPCLVNRPLNEAYRELMTSLGEEVRFANGDEGRISTDFGNVSQCVPGVNVHFGICENGEDAPLHTEALKQAAKTDYGFTQAMKCAAAMAAMGVRYLTEPDFRTAVDEDFQRKKN
jgi:metal-dependent amidase/aminoacylase/carboxypeptidase family protein